MSPNLSKVTILITMLIFTLMLQSCTFAVRQPTSSTVSPTVNNSALVFATTSTPFGEAPVCAQKTVFPIITDIQPSPVLPGSEITIMGRGGYIQDSCGGINESARSFKLYLDNETVGDLLCYVNHCETKINLADSITPKEHCLSTQMSICEFRFQVDSK